MFRFRRFQTRLLVLFLALFTLSQAIALGLTSWAGRAAAQDEIHTALEVAAGVFGSLLEEREARLLQAAVLLADDFAFKSAYATRDAATIESMLHNHGTRIGADAMYLLSLDSEVIASTLSGAREGMDFMHPELLQAATEDPYGEAGAIVLIGDQPYQLVVVPLLIPMHDAWVVVGFRLGAGFTSHFRELTQSEISILSADADRWRVLSTSLPEAAARALPAVLAGEAWRDGAAFNLSLAGETQVSLLQEMGVDDHRRLLVGMHRSLDVAMAPYRRLQQVLLVLLLGGLVLTALGATWVSRQVSKPVRQLRSGAERIEQGDYQARVAIRQADELGALGEAFNRMARGLEERDRVRGLLGKVVSPAIAEELLARDIELGGEEREATVLFSDIVGFTPLAETVPPARLLDLLNRYLTRISADIEAEGGVIDKYIGDAVMALFGAPLTQPDHPERAVRAAMAMVSSVQAMNRETPEHMATLRLGAGINSGTVVAGNMGSRSRLNYTVVGDAVNLASRLEGLTRHYRVDILVSDATRRQCPSIVFRELDRVQVKGRQGVVGIHEPLGTRGRLDSHLHQRLVLFGEGLAHYRQQRWDEAETTFQELAGVEPNGPASVYLARIRAFREQAPPADWDAVTRIAGK
ncbi:MAG: HAMP domain-containing protein [Ectothiorhodospiraceae bacterium]|nr:HAMP domain-containing protein [Ectothiorhodospiraceae bacterium]